MTSGENPFDFSQYNGASGQPAPRSHEAQLVSQSIAIDGSPSPTSIGGAGVVSAPLFWCYLAAGCALVGITLGLIVGGVPAMAITGWAIGGPAAIVLLAVFSLHDTRARTSAMYSASGLATWLCRAVLLLSMVAVVIGALRIANWIGHI